MSTNNHQSSWFKTAAVISTIAATTVTASSIPNVNTIPGTPPGVPGVPGVPTPPGAPGSTPPGIPNTSTVSNTPGQPLPPSPIPTGFEIPTGTPQPPQVPQPFIALDTTNPTANPGTIAIPDVVFSELQTPPGAPGAPGTPTSPPGIVPPAGAPIFLTPNYQVLKLDKNDIYHRIIPVVNPAATTSLTPPGTIPTTITFDFFAATVNPALPPGETSIVGNPDNAGCCLSVDVEYTTLSENGTTSAPKTYAMEAESSSQFKKTVDISNGNNIIQVSYKFSIQRRDNTFTTTESLYYPPVPFGTPGSPAGLGVPEIPIPSEVSGAPTSTPTPPTLPTPAPIFGNSGLNLSTAVPNIPTAPALGIPGIVSQTGQVSTLDPKKFDAHVTPVTATSVAIRIDTKDPSTSWCDVYTRTIATKDLPPLRSRLTNLAVLDGKDAELMSNLGQFLTVRGDGSGFNPPPPGSISSPPSAGGLDTSSTLFSLPNFPYVIDEANTLLYQFTCSNDGSSAAVTPIFEFSSPLTTTIVTSNSLLPTPPPGSEGIIPPPEIQALGGFNAGVGLDIFQVSDTLLARISPSTITATATDTSLSLTSPLSTQTFTQNSAGGTLVSVSPIDEGAKRYYDLVIWSPAVSVANANTNTPPPVPGSLPAGVSDSPSGPVVSEPLEWCIFKYWINGKQQMHIQMPKNGATFEVKRIPLKPSDKLEFAFTYLPSAVNSVVITSQKQKFIAPKAFVNNNDLLIQDVPVPGIPGVIESPPAIGSLTVPGVPGVPGAPGAPGVPGSPPAPPAPGTPEAPPAPGAPGAPPAPPAPGTPEAPPTPGAPGAPNAPGTPPTPPAPTPGKDPITAISEALAAAGLTVPPPPAVPGAQGTTSGTTTNGSTRTSAITTVTDANGFVISSPGIPESELPSETCTTCFSNCPRALAQILSDSRPDTPAGSASTIETCWSSCCPNEERKMVNVIDVVLSSNELPHVIPSTTVSQNGNVPSLFPSPGVIPGTPPGAPGLPGASGAPGLPGIPVQPFSSNYSAKAMKTMQVNPTAGSAPPPPGIVSIHGFGIGGKDFICVTESCYSICLNNMIAQGVNAAPANVPDSNVLRASRDNGANFSAINGFTPETALSVAHADAQLDQVKAQEELSAYLAANPDKVISFPPPGVPLGAPGSVAPGTIPPPRPSVGFTNAENACHQVCLAPCPAGLAGVREFKIAAISASPSSTTTMALGMSEGVPMKTAQIGEMMNKVGETNRGVAAPFQSITSGSIQGLGSLFPGNQGQDSNTAGTAGVPNIPGITSSVKDFIPTNIFGNNNSNNNNNNNNNNSNNNSINFNTNFNGNPLEGNPLNGLLPNIGTSNGNGNGNGNTLSSLSSLFPNLNPKP